MAATATRYAKKGVTVGVLCGMAYINYASMYRLGYHEIWQYHSRGVAVSLWVVSGLCEALCFFYWAVMLIVGAGSVPKIKPYDLYSTGDEALTPMPRMFVCDEFGFPFWCSNCHSVKEARVSHASDRNACVPRFDHYCVWVGTVIGQRNHRPFLKLMWWVECFLIVTLVYLIRYTKANIDKGLDHNYIALYVLSGFWVTMITALFAAHVWYIVHNRTTLDDLQASRARKEKQRERANTPPDTPNNPHATQAAPHDSLVPREDFKYMKFVSIEYDNLRLVVPHKLNPYLFSFRKHWINMLCYNNSMHFYDEAYYSNTQLAKSILVFFVPIIDIFFGEPAADGAVFAPKFVEQIEHSAHLKRCFIASYARPQAQSQVAQAEPPEVGADDKSADEPSSGSH